TDDSTHHSTRDARDERDERDEKEAPPTDEEIEAVVHLGLEALEKDDLEVAVDLLSIVTSFAPDDVDGHVALGIALARRRAVRQAIAVFERAVSLDPTHFLAHLRLGDLYRRSRRKPQSRAHLIAAREAARTAEERAFVERVLSH